MAVQSLENGNREEVFKALENREYIPYFQPQYDYSQKKVIGAEVLARWQKPDGSIGTPASFIPILEESDAIVRFDYQILEEGVRLLAGWQQEGIQLPHTSFNLSRRTLMDADLVTRLKEIFDRYNFDTSLCHLEVTESAYIRNHSDIFNSVRALKEMSFIVEMDDFGSGYSSLGFLRNAPVDVLKLDMSFLQMDENRGKGGSIISAMVRLAGNLNMQIIAEGVETLEQAEFLKSVGCYWMQGFFFARPMSAEQYRRELLETGITVPDRDAFREVNKAVDFLDDTTQSALLFNSFVGGAIIIEYRDGECYPVRANDQFFKCLGLNEEEMSFQCLGPALLEQDSRKRFLSMLEEAIQTETEAECEVCSVLEKNGRKQWFHLRSRCIAKKKNGTYVFYTTLEDITDRKHLDRENADLTEALASVINNTPGGFMRLALKEGEKSNCEFLSNGLASMLGYSVQELMQLLAEEGGYRTIIHPDDADGVSKAMEQMVVNHQDQRLNCRLCRKDGNYVCIAFQCSVVKGQDRLNLYIYCWDETEQEKLRSRLEVRNVEFQNAINSMGGGTMLFELLPDGMVRFMDISEEAAAITGRTAALYREESRKDPLFCVYEADKQKLLTKILEAYCTGGNFDLVFRVVHMNGETIWIRLKGTVTQNECGKQLLYAFISNLTASFENYESIINEADSAIVVTDLDSHEILYANKKAADLGGISPEEAIGHPCYQCLNQCSTIDQKCMAEIPPEGLELDEVREGRVYRVRRKKMNWNGIEAGVCYINDRTDTVSLENRLVDHPVIQGTVLKHLQEKINGGSRQEAAEQAQEKWENILLVILGRKSVYQDLLTQDNLRIRIQFAADFSLMSAVALFMTVLNMVQGMWKLAAITGVFALLSILNIVFAMINEKTERFAQLLFGVEIIGLFTVFAITGNPEGFSILWSVLLPTLGMILYRQKMGILLSAVMWVILIFLFWTPLGRNLLQYQYTATFLTRFPILFFALGGMGTLFEYIRKTTQDELVSLRKQFEHLYNHDALTGLFNRYGFNSTIESITKWGEHGNMAFAIMDLDSFKSVNDTYGHMNGDKVLKTTAANIQEVVGDHGVASRWGGEEFSVLFYKAEEAEELCEKILQVCRNQEYVFNGETVRVTISIGLVKFEGFSLGGSTDVITEADNNLYTSKQNGKDRVTVTDMRTGVPQNAPEE